MKQKKLTLNGHDRYSKSWLVQVNGKEDEYLLYSNHDEYIRCGYHWLPDGTEESYLFVDPSGGPMLVVGNKLWVNDGTIYLGVISEIVRDNTLNRFVI